MKRTDSVALASLGALFAFLTWHARLWHPLWAADLGILPYQCSRAASGDFIYRDFFAKNPPGVFLIPTIVFRLFGSTMASLAFLVALQFTLLVGATYLVARRTAPQSAWVVIPLFLAFCLRNCGLIHHPWAGAVGLLGILVLYDSLFTPAATRYGWLPSGIVLGVALLFHQVLFCTLTLSTTTNLLHRRKGSLILPMALATLATVLGTVGAMTLISGPDLSLPRRMFELIVLTTRGETGLLERAAPAHVTLVTDMFVGLQPRPGFTGLLVNLLEVTNRWLAYFGFPVLALLALIERGAPKSEGPEDTWKSWLILAGSLMSLSAYPQFTAGHLRAFLMPFSFILVARGLERPSRLRTALLLPVTLTVLMGIMEAFRSLAGGHYPVAFPAGTVYFKNARTATQFQQVCKEMSTDEPRSPLISYPYFTMSYFLFQRTNPFRIHEITPALLLATGITTSSPAYQYGLRAIVARPPQHAFYDIREERMLSEVERGLPGAESKPLLDLIKHNYEPVGEVWWAGSEPSLIVLRRKLGTLRTAP